MDDINLVAEPSEKRRITCPLWIAILLAVTTAVSLTLFVYNKIESQKSIDEMRLQIQDLNVRLDEETEKSKNAMVGEQTYKIRVSQLERDLEELKDKSETKTTSNQQQTAAPSAPTATPPASQTSPPPAQPQTPAQTAQSQAPTQTEKFTMKKFYYPSELVAAADPATIFGYDGNFSYDYQPDGSCIVTAPAEYFTTYASELENAIEKAKANPSVIKINTSNDYRELEFIIDPLIGDASSDIISVEFKAMLYQVDAGKKLGDQRVHSVVKTSEGLIVAETYYPDSLSN